MIGPSVRLHHRWREYVINARTVFAKHTTCAIQFTVKIVEPRRTGGTAHSGEDEEDTSIDHKHMMSWTCLRLLYLRPELPPVAHLPHLLYRLLADAEQAAVQH